MPKWSKRTSLAKEFVRFHKPVTKQILAFKWRAFTLGRNLPLTHNVAFKIPTFHNLFLFPSFSRLEFIIFIISHARIKVEIEYLHYLCKIASNPTTLALAIRGDQTRLTENSINRKSVNLKVLFATIVNRKLNWNF